MDIFKKINPLLFIYLFCVGLFLGKYFGDRYQYFFKYPLPYQEHEPLYKKKDGTCYKYEFKPITCSDKCQILRSEEKKS